MAKEVNLGNVVGPQGPQGAKGATGPQGPEGPAGAKGATGTRGSQWYTGTKITGTSTTGTVFFRIRDNVQRWSMICILTRQRDIFIDVQRLAQHRQQNGPMPGVLKVQQGQRGKPVLTGPQGVKGATGPAGADGKTPSFVIENGHLYAVWEG